MGNWEGDWLMNNARDVLIISSVASCVDAFSS